MSSQTYLSRYPSRPSQTPSVARAWPVDRSAIYCTILLFFSYLFPAEAAVRLGMVWTMRRVAIVVCFVPLVVAASQKIRGGRYVPVLSDFFVLCFAFWAPYSIFVTSGAAAVGSNYGINGFELAIPYFVGRVLLGNAQTLRTVSPIILAAMVGLLCLGLVDFIMRENIMARVATGIFGNFRAVKQYGTQEVLAYTTQYRFGLARARGPIEHSILYGTFFVVVLPLLLYNLTSEFQRLLAAGTCILGTLISLSSAPILLLIVFLALFAYDRLFNNLSWRWPFLIMMVILLLATILAIVDDPIVAFIQGFTLDPATGMTRLQIWHWVGQNLTISPVFGVGARDWFRPADMLSSIDALWLNLALQYGYVGLGLIIAIVIGSFFVITPRRIPSWRYPESNAPRLATTLSVVLYIIATFTVHLWGASWGLFGLLLGMRAAFSEAPYLPPPPQTGRSITASRA